MKAKSRRELINENKQFRKDLNEQNEKHFVEIKRMADYVQQAQKETEEYKDRLRAAGLKGGYEYTHPAGVGTVVYYVTISPHEINVSTNKYPEQVKEQVAMELAGRIAAALINEGLVLLENGGVDNYSGCQIVKARLDVIPWQRITKKNDKVVLQAFGERGNHWW